MTEREEGKLKVRIYENRRLLGSDAAEMAALKINGLLKTKDRVNIIFAAATSQNEFLDALSGEPVDWTRINAFHMDEYIGLPEGAPQQFSVWLKKRFFGKHPFHGVHYLNGRAPDLQAECMRYAELLQQNPVDLAFMGIGENAHLAFNDPHVADFRDVYTVKVVDLDEACKQQQVNDHSFEELSRVPAYALTLTIPALLRAAYIYCMVPGARKAEAVYNTLTAPVTEHYPSTILRSHDHAFLFLDRESAARVLTGRGNQITTSKKKIMTLQTAALLEQADQGQYKKNITIIGLFFFIFGFITWINATLIPYLRIACELKEWEAYLVTFAFYISYTLMAIPSSRLLQRTGMINGMSIGLAVMGIGCVLFIPAALTRQYSLFLTGLIFAGAGLTLLQTAVNPYITFLGPENEAAKRISIMGICNKTAGILAPLVMGGIILKNSGGLLDELKQMNDAQKELRLNVLSQTVITPYTCLAALLLLIAILIRYAHLPELKPSAMPENTAGEAKPLNEPVHIQYILGFTAIFFAVGCEVLSADTIGNYGLYYGINLDISKHLASYPLTGMMIGYIIGIICIPKYISQQKAFSFSCQLGLIITPFIAILPGNYSIACVALLGLANAMLWPAIWPQALNGLRGKALAKGSAILIMGIAGGALMPLTYGWLSTFFNNQNAYLLFLPAYGYLLYYSRRPKKRGGQGSITQHG